MGECVALPLHSSREIGDFEFEIGRGPGFEPGPSRSRTWRGRVLRSPTDSRVVLANTKSTGLVSYGDPPYSRPVPRMSDTAVIGQVTKFGLADGFTGERIKL